MGCAKSKNKGFLVFNPNLYWKRRGKYYLREFEEQSAEESDVMKRQDEAILNYLDGLEFSSVLDVGCGFGRMAKLIARRYNCQRVVGIDLSQDQIINARQFAEDKNTEFVTGNVLKMKLSDGSFDLVFSCTLLMHIPPGKIKKALSETIRISRRFVVNVDWYERDYSGPRAQHNWCHDYFDLYEKMNYGVKGTRTLKDSNQYLFCLDKVR